MGYALRGAAIAVLFAGLALPATAGDPTGTWLTQGGKSRVRIANCGRALCGTIAWLNEPNDPQTGRLSETEVRDNILTFVMAGHETTALL